MLEPIIDKVSFVLGIYQKYQENFEAKKTVLASEAFRWGKEKRLLLQEIDGEFEKFLSSFQPFLKTVIEKVSPPPHDGS